MRTQWADLHYLYLTRLTEKADEVCMDTAHPRSGEFQPLILVRGIDNPKIRTIWAKNYSFQGNDSFNQDA